MYLSWESAMLQPELGGGGSQISGARLSGRSMRGWRGLDSDLVGSLTLLTPSRAEWAGASWSEGHVHCLSAL